MSMIARAGLCKKALSSTFRVNALSKPFWTLAHPSLKKFKEIPGPLSLPIVGNLWNNFRGKNLENAPFIYEKYLRAYGPLVKERVFIGRTLVHVFDPQDMEKIYRLDKVSFPECFNNRALNVYRNKCLSWYGNGELLSSNGREWEELRKAVGNDLLHKRSNKAFEEITNDLVEEISKQNRQVVLLPLLYRWSIECLGAATVGQRIGALENDVDDRISNFIQSIRNSQEAMFYTQNFPKILTRRYYKKLEESQDFMFSFLKRHTCDIIYKYHKMDEQPHTLVDDGEAIRLHKCMAYNFTRKDLDERDIKSLVIDMFHEGVLSTAHILAFALYYLAENSDIQNSIRDNLIQKFPNPEDVISFEPVITEIRNVVLETMRLNPPKMGTSRVLREPLVLSGYIVPKGTRCILHHQVASMQKKHFLNSFQFIPHRFQEPLWPLPKASSVACSPFGMGRRDCPAKEVAMNEIAIGLSVILRRFEVYNSCGKVGTKSGFMNRPDKEIILTFSKSKM